MHRSLARSLSFTSLVTLVALGSGCPEDPAPNDAAVLATDTGGTGGDDTGLPADDTGAPAEDTGMVGEDAPASGDVARCTATAAMVATACNGQADRTCEHTQAGMRCTTERADVLADAYQCLLGSSTGTGSCRTYGDPSGATDCLTDLVDTTPLTAAGTALAEDLATLCPTAERGQLLSGGVVPLIALSDATIGRLSTCLGTIADCSSFYDCLAAEYPTIVACYP